MTVPHPNQAMPHQEHNLTLSVWERSTWIRFFVCATIADHEHGMPRRARTMGSSWLAGWLHGVFVGDWLFVFPLCGFSLSLFCNCSSSLVPGRSPALQERPPTESPTDLPKSAGAPGAHKVTAGSPNRTIPAPIH